MIQTRRKFLKQSGRATLGLGLMGLYACGNTTPVESEERTSETTSSTEMFFKISLAQWSLHNALQKGQMDNLEFAAKTRKDFGIEAIEYVNQFFKDKATDAAYLAEMNKRAADSGVKQLLIMIDGEGGLAETDDAQRKQAIENHYKWVDAAKTLGCHAIRVNAYSSNPNAEEAAKAAVDGLGSLAEFAQKSSLSVIVENHGGFSSNGQWLSSIMSQINMANCGTLPDFGNFCVDWKDGGCREEYDRYKGVTELMPFAKAVSAKSNDFNEAGDEIHTDYMKMMKIVKDAGYTGYVGIEYEGNKLGEDDGIKATKALLEKVGAALG